MQENFDTLIDSFIKDRVGIAENFLRRSLLSNLTNNLKTLYAAKKLRDARIGNNNLTEENKLFRSDRIYWLDREHNDKYENDFFDVIDKFVSYLNATCYTGITGYEFHYTIYEEGSFYKKHTDQFKNNNSRQYSIIVYLNEGWQPIDGGELCIYYADRMQKITPDNGKVVFFKSNELEHEVMLVNKPRLSITGWLKTAAT